ncbi:putative NRPS-like protein biosynthetic cluster, partial [Ascosphaera aggregata]
MSTITQGRLAAVQQKYGELRVMDDMIRHRADDKEPKALLAYPKGSSLTDYEYISAKDINQFIDAAVKHFISFGLGPSEPGHKKTVALLSISDLDMFVTFFALSRLGHTVLLLSVRLPPSAIEKLMQETESTHLVYSTATQIRQTVANFNKDVMSLYELPTRATYDVPLTTALFSREFDRDSESVKPCLILHSSGSTGFPKPITLTHRAVCNLVFYPLEMKSFTTFPLFHMGGLFSILVPVYQGSTLILPNPLVPQTAESIATVIEATKPEWTATVPYLLSHMVQSERGIAALRTLKSLVTGGSRCSDELGDRLLNEGVNFGLLFGATENGVVAETLTRPQGDDEWSYLRVCDYVVKYLYWECVDKQNNYYEAIFLPGLASLSAANSDFPVLGSFRSRDVFQPHPTIPNAWKYVTRLDDRVTLTNGEKVLPLPIEGIIRADPLVRECVIFGVGQSVPGLLVFSAPEGDHLSREAFIKAIWPTVEDANSRAERFAKIAKDLIIVKDSTVEYPRSDKGTFIRNQVYKAFDKEITEIYAAAEKSSGKSDCGLVRLDQRGLVVFLISYIQKNMGIDIKPEDDLFTAGVDSLRAMQLRRVIMETIATDGVQLPANVVYNSGNVKDLAEFIDRARQGGKHDLNTSGKKVEAIKAMVAKYSNFPKHVYMNGRAVENDDNDDASKYSAIITGTTGSIGAHVLDQLLKKDKNIKTVYCFCRGSDSIVRVIESLRMRKLIKSQSDEEFYRSRIVVLTAEPHDDNFGLDMETLHKMKREVGVIIHSAWPVNFNIPLRSFETHIRGLKNLIDFSLCVERRQPAQVHFASSISAALNVAAGSVIPDKRVADYDQALPTGYAQSKLVGEEICLAANELVGANTFVLRIGQITGDTKEGIWNETESFPMM